MDKQEYTELKAKIIQDFGNPEWDNKAPGNESAVRINKLMTEYRLSCLKAVRDAAATQKQNDLETGRVPAPGERPNKPVITALNIEGVDINENDLAPFTDVEREAIRIKFENWTLRNKQISHKLTNFSTQQVTALLDSPAFRLLQSKVFDRLLTLEVNLALLAAVRQGDSKVIQRLAEQKGILKPEKLEVDLNKPLEDPIALKLLKDLGDKIIDGK